MCVFWLFLVATTFGTTLISRILVELSIICQQLPEFAKIYQFWPNLTNCPNGSKDLTKKHHFFGFEWITYMYFFCKINQQWPWSSTYFPELTIIYHFFHQDWLIKQHQNLPVFSIIHQTFTIIDHHFAKFCQNWSNKSNLNKTDHNLPKFSIGTKVYQKWPYFTKFYQNLTIFSRINQNLPNFARIDYVLFQN